MRPTAAPLVLIIFMALCYDLWKDSRYRVFFSICIQVVLFGALFLILTAPVEDNNYSPRRFSERIFQKMNGGMVISGCKECDYIFPGDLTEASTFTKYKYY